MVVKLWVDMRMLVHHCWFAFLKSQVSSLQINGIIHKDPLTRKEALAKLEALYDTLLHVEQMRREQPSPDDQQKAEEW